MLALAAASLLYGIFHALGPGHGKTIVSTFFLAKEAKLRHSLIAGYLIALVHAISALTIVLALFFIVRGVFSTGFESASRIVQTLSFGAIALIGAVMLVQRIRGKEHSHGHGLPFGLGKGHEHEHEHEHARARGRASPARSAGKSSSASLSRRASCPAPAPRRSSSSASLST